jgi:DSF synthase
MISTPVVKTARPQATHSGQIAYGDTNAPTDTLKATYDPLCGAAWFDTPPNAILGFNLDRLREIWSADQSIADSGCVADDRGMMCPIRYHVTACGPAQTYNLGDNLALLMRLLESQDRNSLMQYAGLHADMMHRRLDSYGRPIVTISVAQGEVLGNGFEAIVAADVVIAERSSQFGFPDSIYNLFPGAGGYSVLVRKIGQRRAEEIIAGGGILTGAELADLGVVDLLAEDGQGPEAAISFMKRRLRSHNGYSAMLRARKAVQAITREELHRVATTWVDAALRLDREDLRAMARVIQAQRSRLSGAGTQYADQHTPRRPDAMSTH